MDSALLIPVPDAIPVGWGWFEGLNLLTFTLHIIMVNILVGGGVLAAYLAFADRENPLVGSISGKLPTIFALTVNFGVAPLLFLQVVYGHFFYTSAVLSAVWWLSVIVLLISGYYSLYIHQYRQKAGSGGLPIFLLLGLGLILCISLVLTSVLTTMENPGLWSEYFSNTGGTVINFFQATTVPRYLHFLLACIAMGGLFAALLSEWDKRLAGGAADKARAIGMKLFTTSSLLQMATGLWWLMALERSVMLQFMGDNVFATGLLVVAVVLTFPALAAGFSGKPKSAAVWTFLVIALMVGVRAVIRNLTLAPHFSPGDLAVTGEVSPLVLFLVSLVLGLIIVAYMLRLAFRTPKEV